jgi:hypothetical protein
MLGIILTLLAVLLVLCFAFYHSDHPIESGVDALLYSKPKKKRNSSEPR